MLRFLTVSWLSGTSQQIAGAIVATVIIAGAIWFWNRSSDSAPTPCLVTYHSMGGVNDAGERLRGDELEGAKIYFLNLANWPGSQSLTSLGLTGGGILAQGEVHQGKTVVSFAEGAHKATVVLVKDDRRYWAIHDRTALPFIESAPRHEFACKGGKVVSS